MDQLSVLVRGLTGTLFPNFSNVANTGGAAGSTIRPRDNGIITAIDWSLFVEGVVNGGANNVICYILLVKNPSFNVFDSFRLTQTGNVIFAINAYAVKPDSVIPPPYTHQHGGNKSTGRLAFTDGQGYPFQANDALAIVAAFGPTAINSITPAYFLSLNLEVVYQK